MRNEHFRDFRNMVYAVWKHLGLPDPTPVQYDICYALQNGSKRQIISAFRGVGKSWITSVYVLWLLYWDPTLNILVVSASKQRADDFTTFTLRLIHEIDFLQHLRPDEKSGHRSSKIAFDVSGAPAAHAPSVKSVGILGQMAGSRADVIIPDDIEVPGNSETQGMREKLAMRVQELDAILKPFDSHMTFEPRIICLGTPQTEDSVYSVLEKRGYTKTIWPSRYPTDAWMEGNGYALAPKIERERTFENCHGFGASGTLGAPTDSGRFGEEDLVERELSYGRSGFSLQFMLDTTLSDADRHPLKLLDLIVMDLDLMRGSEHPVWASNKELNHNDLPNVGMQRDRFVGPMALKGDMTPYDLTLMAVDPAGRGGDELAITVVKVLNGFIFLFECTGLLGGYDDTNLEYIANRAKHYGVNLIVAESNMGDGMFTHLLKPVLQRIYPCTIEEVRQTKQKEARIIDTLEPVMNQHKLIVDRRVVIADIQGHKGEDREETIHRQLFHQMTRITKDRGCLKHDDRLDSLAIAVAYVGKYTSQDPLSGVDARQHMRAVDELRRHEEFNIMGKREGRSNRTFLDRHRTNDRKSPVGGRFTFLSRR